MKYKLLSLSLTCLVAQPGLGTLTHTELWVEGVFRRHHRWRSTPRPGQCPSQVISDMTHSGYQSLYNKPPHDLKLKIMTTIISRMNLHLGPGLGRDRSSLLDSVERGQCQGWARIVRRLIHSQVCWWMLALGSWLLAEHQAGPSATTPTHSVSVWPGLPHNTVAVGQGQAS